MKVAASEGLAGFAEEARAGSRDGPLDDALNVAAYLPRLARERSDALAIAVAKRGGGYERLSFAELDRRCDRIAHGLVSAGITSGVRTVLMVKPSSELFALTFALFKVGAVPVFVDPGMGLSRLGTCLAEAEPEAFIGIPKAQAARLLLGWARRTIRRCVTVGRFPLARGVALDELERAAPDQPFAAAAVTEDQPAAILFTSGSTGCPKGALYTHGMFASQVRMLRRSFGIAPGEVDLSTFPLFALFGPALGMASVVPWMDASRPARADPRQLLRAIEDFACTTMFASPALIDKVGRFGAESGLKIPSLRRAISAGAPASPPALERFARLLEPGAEVFTPYGATEALPVSVIGSTELLAETRGSSDRGRGICVGRPCEELALAIIETSDEPIARWDEARKLPVGEVGEIAVSGPVVSPAYYGRLRETALAKVREPGTGRIWHRMGDLGWLDAEGRLWMCGRKSQRVQLGSRALLTVPCESVFNTHPDVRRSALVGVARGGSTLPVICVELERGVARARRQEIRQDLARLAAEHAHTQEIQTFLFHPRFPVDIRHNAKIGREKLARWAARRLR